MFRSPFADGLVVLVLILLFAGPKRLPMLSRSIGESIKEFRGGIGQSHDEKHEKQHLDAAPLSQPTAETTEKRETVS
jgi:TatA/E family protein of Tat protein translocase